MKTRQRFEIIPRVVDTSQRRIILNVGGRKHETYLSTVKNYPDTRLYWVVENVTKAIDYDSERIELFFDRHPGIFEQVLNYYRTGKLHCPHDVCGPLFEEELAYWGIDEKEMEHCCWTSYTQHREAEHNLKSFNVPDGEQDQDTDLESDRMEDSTPARDCGRPFTWWTKYQPKIWPILEEPHSSKAAKILSIISITLILLSVGTSCALTLPQFSKHSRSVQGPAAPARDSTTVTIFTIIEFFCGIWFTLELVLRIIFCPRRRVFFRMVTNWIDILSVMPFYIRILAPDGVSQIADALLMIRLLRLFRFFRLLYGLQILLHTLKASSYELGLLLLILFIPVILFSSIIYYVERTMDDIPTKFRSIPESFWWSLITMTTVGYGDITPNTWLGKIIGGACAVCGLLVVALPISIIGSNFNLYYAHAQARLKLPRRKNKVLLNSITSDFSNRGNLSGVRRRGLRIRSNVSREPEEDDCLMSDMLASHSSRQNSLAKQSPGEVKRNSTTWSIPSSKSDNEGKTSPTSTRPTRERRISRNERVVPKLGDLPEKDETEENDGQDDNHQISKQDSIMNNNVRNSLGVPGVSHVIPKDRLPLWIAENGKNQRVRSFSVPSNSNMSFPEAPPRKTQSQNSHVCKRCSLPKDTQSICGEDNRKCSSGEVCCCAEKDEIPRGSRNNSTYTIFIPGTDEGVQVSTESLPSWSRELPFEGISPIQLDVVPCWKRRRFSDEDSEPDNLNEADERETLVSELSDSRTVLDGKRKEPNKQPTMLYIDMPGRHGNITENETSI